MSSFGLKLTAIVSMLIDHVGYAFSGIWNTVSLRMIGRVAFPLFAFMIAEGCSRTSDIRKYLLRLGIFALISEIPYDFFRFGKLLEFEYQNVFFTLFLGAAACAAYDKLPRIGRYFIFIPFAALAYYMNTDYNMLGVTAIFFCYVIKTNVLRVAVLTLVMLVFYSDRIQMFYACLPAMLMILLYNGQRGIPFKLVFYIFYPAHLILIAGVKYYWGLQNLIRIS